MVTLRITTNDKLGNPKVTTWSFRELDEEDQYDIPRESTDGSDGTPNRRPLFEREVRILTLGAGLLRRESNWQNFKRLLRADKIEWQRSIGGKQVWVEYALNEEQRVSLERHEDHARLRRKKITLIQSKGLSYTSFEDDSKQFTDLKQGIRL